MQSASEPGGPWIRYLEMTDRGQLRPKPLPAGVLVQRVEPPDFQINRRFYEQVGRAWRWVDRLRWSEESWRRYAERSELETWRGLSGSEPIGYFELECQANEVQVAYFGLLPDWIGQGMGGPLLTAAIQRAWSVPGTRRVWLHTCSQDHPRALDNYLRRGFTVYRVENP